MTITVWTLNLKQNKPTLINLNTTDPFSSLFVKIISIRYLFFTEFMVQCEKYTHEFIKKKQTNKKINSYKKENNMHLWDSNSQPSVLKSWFCLKRSYLYQNRFTNFYPLKLILKCKYDTFIQLALKMVCSGTA